MKKTMNNHDITIPTFTAEEYKILCEFYNMPREEIDRELEEARKISVNAMKEFKEIVDAIIILKSNLESKYPDKKELIAHLGEDLFNPKDSTVERLIEKIKKEDIGSGVVNN